MRSSRDREAVVLLARLHEFCVGVFPHLGVPEADARLAADVLSATDRRGGIDSHGVGRALRDGV